MENTNPNACSAMEGGLPGKCANLAFPYIAMQGMNAERYDQAQALAAGTLFPGLNLPLFKAVKSKMNCDNTALCELMALSFAVDELGLYLTTHAQDQEALQLYWSYVKLLKEGQEKYQKMHGPLLQTDLTPEDGYAWLKDPWPWDFGGND